MLVLASTVSLLAGCAAVPMGDPAQDASLKKFNAPQDKAALYVYRNETFGAAVKMGVVLDGKMIGDTAAHTYLYKEVDPGHHTVVSKSEEDSEVNFDAVAGHVYYVWQEIKMGLWQPNSKLHLVEAKEGQAGVTESKLVVGAH